MEARITWRQFRTFKLRKVTCRKREGGETVTSVQGCLWGDSAAVRGIGGMVTQRAPLKMVEGERVLFQLLLEASSTARQMST